MSEPSPNVPRRLNEALDELARARAELARREGDPTYRMHPDDELAFTELALAEFNEEIN